MLEVFLQSTIFLFLLLDNRTSEPPMLLPHQIADDSRVYRLIDSLLLQILSRWHSE